MASSLHLLCSGARILHDSYTRDDDVVVVVVVTDLLSVCFVAGERVKTKHNNLLGSFELTGIPPAPRGIPQIEVTFEIDVNGILQVSAEDKGTGQKNNIVIENSLNRLSDEDIDRMVRDAELAEEEDKSFKANVDARNDLEHYTYSLKNQINDQEKLGGKLSADDKSEVTKALEETIQWLEDNREAETDEYKEKKGELESVFEPIVKKMYADSSNGSNDHEEL